MPKKPTTILAINPGTKYLGFAVLHNGDLRDWGIKTVSGKWSEDKMQRIMNVISALVSKHRPDTLSIKKLHPSRSSLALKKLTVEIMTFARSKRIVIYQYSIEDLKKFYSPVDQINRRELAEIIGIEYPVLLNELDREVDKKKQRMKNYHSRMFEAVALGTICAYTLDYRL